MNQIQASQLLQQLNQLSERVDADKLLNNVDAKSDNSFSNLMKETLSNINEQQLSASNMGTEYQLGNKNIDTAQLMIEIQKARVSFEALNQFRNQVVSAYQDVMNMQV